MSVMVTGGTGFVGSNVNRTLIKEGTKALAYDLQDRKSGVTADVADRITLVKGDLLDLAKMLGTVRKYGVGGIIHTAADMSPRDVGVESPIWTFKSNVEGTANVLETARLADLRRVVYTSTCGVYGYLDSPDASIQTEDERPNPRGPYAITKYMGELMCRNYFESYGIDGVILRLPIMYGPGRMERGRRRTPMDMLVESIVHSRPLHLANGGDYVSDYSYIEDIVRGILLAYNASSLKHRLYNINSGSIVKLSQAFELAKRMYPKADLTIGPGTLPGEMIIRPMDITRIRAELGYLPLYDFEKGLAKTVEWTCRRRE